MHPRGYAGSGDVVARVIADRLPKTLDLAFASILLVMGVSLPVGMLAAALTGENRNRGFELAFTAATSVV